MATMATRIQNAVPFHAFKFFMHRAEPFLNFDSAQLGIWIREATVANFWWNRNPDFLIDFLGNTPNLQTLILKNCGNDVIDFPETPTHQNLRSLRLEDKVSCAYHSIATRHIELKIVREWILNFPALKELHSDIHVLTESNEELYEFLKSAQHLKSMPLKIWYTPTSTVTTGSLKIPPHFKFNTILCVNTTEETGELIRHWLAAISGFLKSLKIQLHPRPGVFHLPPILPQLEKLLIEKPYYSTFPTQLNIATRTCPNLRKLVLYFRNVAAFAETQMSTSDIFETVDTFYVRGKLQFQDLGMGRNWHLILPNLKSFGLNCGTAEELEYVVTVFPDLENLYLSDLNFTAALFRAKFDLSTTENDFGDPCDRDWPLSKLLGKKQDSPT